MISFIRRHLSYANIVATMALVFAMGGSAVAAKHYLINSTSQINPKVLKKLVGNRGSTGVAGAIGAAGSSGSQGKEGLGGKEGKEGKEGKPGVPGTAVGYADIASDGSFQLSTTPFNVSGADVHKVATGEYCFVNLPFTPRSAMVSADNSFGANTTIVSVLTFGPGEVPTCPVRVRTFNDTGGAVTQTDEPFNIWFN